ncbi:hypothetical protein DLJ53_31840 [Acuticoccus sediminis]|uniref:Uncharacterized protein n=1 Tax=Acuticoccus sediminis TaxID=2184697 RepID=A0A8B2NKF3_9HYPH|nr:hypothetical protein [Acuticoccus sediminis]RAH96511.1 hypothetical protein DLJ53_31840 [Acuticoccus sediminis]
MATVALYPALTSADDARDVIPRLAAHLAPVLARVEAVSVASTLGPLQLSGLAPPSSLALPASSDALGDRLTVYPARGMDEAAWTSLIGAADTLYIWQVPRAGTGPFATLEALRAAAPGTALVLADPEVTPDDTARLAAMTLALSGAAGTLAAESEAKRAALAGRIGASVAHLVGAGASAAQLRHFDLREGDVVAAGALAVEPERFAALAPRIVCAGDSALHVGPSAAAVRVRAALDAALEAHDFTLVVPLRDLPAHLAAIAPAHHGRVIGLPLEADAPDDALGFMLAFAAALYESVTVSGWDGLAVPRALAASLSAAHPAHCAARLHPGDADGADAALEGIAAAAEARGVAIAALTASDRPALLRRGAAEPRAAAPLADPDGPVTVLSLAPGLVDAAGRAFAAEVRLAAELAARGVRHRVAASQHMRPDAAPELDIDPALSLSCRTLGTAAERDPAALPVLTARVAAEFARTVDRALAGAPGPLLVTLDEGSLAHLAILARLAEGRPAMRVLVHLSSLRTEEIRATDFTVRHAAALYALAANDAVQATVPTVHQRDALVARTGIALSVAPRPSPFFADAEARERAAAPLARPAGGTPLRILLPAARAAEGAALSAGIGAALRVLFTGEPLSLVFGTDPLAAAGSWALKDALGPFEVLPPGLSGGAFVDALAAADAVVLPLLPPGFADRPTDLAAACLYAGTPVATCSGTWLAAFVADHHGGMVVDAPVPRTLAEAAARLARAGRAGRLAFGHGVETCLAAHSWSGLADRILAAAPLAKGAAWRRSEAAHVEAIDAGALPLVTAQRGAGIDYGRLFNTLALAPAASRTLWSGLRTDGFGVPPDPETDLSAGLSGTLIVADPYVYAAARAGAGGAWQVVDARPLEPDARIAPLTAATAGALDAAGPETALILLESFDEGMAPALWRALARAPRAGVVLGVARPAFDRPGRVAAHLGEELERLGFTVALVERRPDGSGAAALWRATLGPVWPATPSVPADVVAVRGAGAAALKAAFAAALTMPDTGRLPPAEIGAAAPAEPAQALPLSPETTLKAVRDPDTDGWTLASLVAAGAAEDGFVPFAEAEAADKRVHSAGVRIEADTPLTVSVEVQPLTTRYVTLALADPGNRPLAAAVFDLVEDEVLSVTRDSRAVPVTPSAGLAADGAVRRIWLSLEELEAVGPVITQVVLREDASGSVHYVGTPRRRIGLRHLVVERRAEPSVLPDEGLAPLAPPSPGAPAVPAAGEPAPASGPAPAAPAPRQERFAADLMARQVGADPATAWVAAETAEVEAAPEGLAFARNGCPYTGQLATVVDVGRSGPYRIAFDFAAVEPEVHIVVNDKVVQRINDPGAVTVEVGATTPRIAIELRAANSHMGRFVLKGLTVEAAA